MIKKYLQVKKINNTNTRHTNDIIADKRIIITCSITPIIIFTNQKNIVFNV
jgi:hypothetical protein